MWPDRHEHREEYGSGCGHAPRTVHREGSTQDPRALTCGTRGPLERLHLALTPGPSQEAAKKCSQVDRPISTGELNALLHLHFQPINLVFYQEPDRET